MKKNISMSMKVLVIAVMSLLVMLAGSMTAYAAEWKQDVTGWWYQNDNGTYPVNTWQWIDGNNDRVSECYYFGADGYMVSNGIVDGYTVNADGQWVVNGVVQVKSISVEEDSRVEREVEEVYEDFVEEKVAVTEDKEEGYGTDYSDWFDKVDWSTGDNTNGNDGKTYNWF